VGRLPAPNYHPSVPARETRVIDSRTEKAVEHEGAPLQLAADGSGPSTLDRALIESAVLLDLPADVPPGVGPSQIGRAERRLSVTDPDEAQLMASFAVLLARYTRQTTMIITHVVDRDAASARPLFAPLQLQLGDEPSFETLVQRVSGELRAAGRRRVDADELVAATTDAAGDERSPLTQVLFAVPGTDLEAVGFELALSLTEEDGAETAVLLYETGLFTSQAAERMLGHLEVILEAGLARPRQPMWQLPLLTDSEHEQLLVEWNATGASYPARRAEELVSAQAAATPRKVAVRCGADELTYEALDTQANQLAHRLQRLGVAPDVPVGVCIDRSLEMIVALLAVWKAGGAYVPIDPAFPVDRQRFMFEDSELHVLLTQESLLRDLPLPDDRVICLDRDRADIAAESASLPTHDGGPEDLAYIIYTSGSTGRPKGVQIPHRALVNFLTTMAARPGFEADDVLVAVTTLSFDIAGLELYLPLTRGGKVVLASRETASDPRALADLIEQSKATVVQATPTTWRMLVDAGWPGRAGLKELCGGEALPRALAEQLLERGVELWNMYGPTETTIWSTVRAVTNVDEPLSIGRPIGNTTLYILDERLQPVPVGVAGELFIGGHGLARGYFKRPELTAERFLAHPFDSTPGARVYRTGDLARYLPDGNVEFLGRLDYQVKVRGFRIELGEIEYALARHPGVSAAVATTREDSPGDIRLVGYVVPTEGAVSGTELRRWVAETLPSYMVPSQIVALEAFPTTPNGKIDRKGLPAPAGDREADLGGVVGPRNELEEKLVAIWEDVLGVHPIGVTDDFFELGTTSILAARVFARIEHELGAKLPLAPIFQAPTIEQLVDLIEDGREGPRWTSLVPMQPHGSKPPIFCVHGGAGTILHLQPLVRHLGQDQPFYGLQMRGLNGHVGPHLLIEQMSVHYLSELRALQPRGPYFLAGYCFGGIVAFDMAQRLLGEGEDVATLVMFNSPSPSWLRRYGGIDGQPSRVGSRPPAAPLRPLVNRIAGVVTSPRKIRHWIHYTKHLVTTRYVNPVILATCARFDLPMPEHARDDLFLRICAKEERRYQALPYQGEIVMFYGEGLYDDPKLGWGDVAGRVVSHMVPGKHTLGNRESFAEPKVAFIAKRLEEHLAAVAERRAHDRAEPVG
jgi:amino acid adenylation domain-containing protein